MTRTISIHLAFGLVLNVTVYLSIAFVQWNLSWAADLPRYSEDNRLTMLICGYAMNAFTHVTVGMIRWARK